jgi:hypothetical protein
MESRRCALIDMDKDVLETRMRAYYDPKIDWLSLKALGTGLTENVAGFLAEKVRPKVQEAEVYTPSRICRYTFHPFDTRWCYYSGVTSLWHRSRPDLWAQCWAGNSFLVTRLKTEKEAKGSPFYFSHHAA